MRDSMIAAAEIRRDVATDSIGSENGEEFYLRSIKTDLTCLRRDGPSCLPTEDNIRQVLEQSRESSFLENLLRPSGLYHRVGCKIFKEAIESDEVAGTGDFFPEDGSAAHLPKCRNKEYHFVAGMCGYDHKQIRPFENEIYYM